MQRLTVAVLTYKRPDELGRGLPIVLAQVRELGARFVGEFVGDVLVVDNDPDGSARQAVDEFNPREVRYVVEPKPGIAAGRNRALDECTDSDLLVFIDDDEQPREAWLESLVQTWRDNGRPTGVMGRVVSKFRDQPAPWVAAGDFFERPRMKTGTEIQVAATGNLLLDLHQVHTLSARFSEAFGLSAGEDVLFTRQLFRRGGRLVWCDESVAEDFVSSDRLTRRWLLSRAWSHGVTTSRIEMYLAEGPFGRLTTRLRLTGGGLARLLAGFARFGLGIVTRSYRHQARGLRTARRGGGMIVGAFGLVYQEYARTRRQRVRFRLRV